MGGSGGGFFSSRLTPEQLARRTREAEEKAGDSRFETQVAGFLNTELAAYNDRDISATQSVFDDLKRDLEEDIEGAVDLLFGGSIAKHTYVDGLSDVDALVLLDKSELRHSNPRTIQELLANRLQVKYPRANVSIGQLAVTMELDGNTIQLLPALREGERLKIAHFDGLGWSKIDPKGFSNALTRENQRMGGKLVPCIKLAKAIIATFPEKRRLVGYHVESLAVQIFRDYEEPKTPKAMLSYFFEQAATNVRRPIRDSSGQSVHVDEYLGEPDSIQRRIVADGMGRVARRIRNADGAQSLEGWRELFE